jgi:hypothetical protein
MDQTDFGGRQLVGVEQHQYVPRGPVER